MKRFVTLLSLCCLLFGTARADFIQTWTANPVGPWSQAGSMQLPGSMTAASGTLYYYGQTVSALSAGTVTIVFKYTSGNHAVKILGIDLVGTDGNVAYSDYRMQTEGGTGINDNTQATYTFENVAQGTYTLRYFIDSVTNVNEVNKTNGNITVTGLVQGKFISSVNELSNDKVYVIKSGRSSGTTNHYLLYHTTAPNNLSSTYGSGHALTFKPETTNFHFAIYKSGEQYYFYNVAADKFVGNNSNNDGAIPLTGLPTNDMEIRDCSSESAEYNFKLSTNRTGALNAANTANCHGVVNWTGGYNNNDAGNRYQILEIGDIPSETKTKIENRLSWVEGYNNAYNLAAGASTDQYGAYTPGALLTLSDKVYTFGQNLNQEDYDIMMAEYNSVLENGARVTLSKGEKFTVKCIDTSRGYLVYSTVENKGSNTNAYLAGAGSAYNSYIPGLNDAGVFKEWSIYSIGDDAYLYNEQKQQFIKPTTPVQFCDDAHPIVFEQVAGTYNQWKIKFKENNNYLGFSPGYDNGQIVRSQTSTDNGNIFIIEKTETSVSDDLANKMEAKILKSEITSAREIVNYVGDGVGKYSYSGSADVSATISQADVLISAETPTAAEMKTCLTTLKEIAGTMTINQPATKKLYRFVCVGNTSGNRLTSNVNASSQIITGDPSGNLKESVFYLTEDNKLLSYSTGQYIGAFSSNRLKLFDVGTTGVAVSFEDVYDTYAKHPGTYSIRVNSRSLYGADELMNSGSTTEDRDGYFWRIEEVTWLPIPINNTYRLGTFYSPVNLAASDGQYTENSRLKFFTGKIDEEGYVTLSKHSGNIPAETPFLIEMQEGAAYDNGCVYMKVADSAEAVDANTYSMQGSLETQAYTAPANEEEITVYTLQRPSDPDTAATPLVFRKFNGTKLQGCRAYLNTGGIAVKGMRFKDDVETGIESIASQNTEPKTIYDLSGRRVQNAGKGLYIVNGKKMFIK